MSEKVMPIGTPGNRPNLELPWGMLEPHETQCMTNHGQTLERIRQRGGFNPQEVLAVLEDRRFEHMDRAEALRRIRKRLHRYLSDIIPEELRSRCTREVRGVMELGASAEEIVDTMLRFLHPGDVVVDGWIAYNELPDAVVKRFREYLDVNVPHITYQDVQTVLRIIRVITIETKDQS